jgi:hypothetical protein
MPITQERLKELLHYDPESGLFINKVKRSVRSKVGTVTGNYMKNGYIHVQLEKEHYLAHRLAFLYMEGYMPKQVDHDNRIRSDNRWCNLKASCNADNQKNSNLYKNNTSGHIGVFFYKNFNKWGARITINGKLINLGIYSDINDAIEARRLADIKYNSHPMHGKNYG